MTIALVLVVVSALALIGLLWLARGQSPSVAAISQVNANTRPVDIVAFRNLVDPSEEDYLRENLSPADFRSIRRERLLAAIAYLRCVGHNAAVLLRLGESARRSHDPEVVKAGEDLVHRALTLRLSILSAE